VFHLHNLKKINPMKKSMFILAMLSLSAFYFMTSCARENSDDVNQDRIYCEYELSYNANEDKTYARAIFKFGNALGTLLELTSPSEVRFNGDLLTFKSALAYYEKDYAGFTQSGTFTWKDTDGNEFSNTISIVPIDYPAALDTIPRSGAYELFWVGDSLSANQSVILTANGVLEGDAQIFTQTNLNSKSIILPANQLQILGKGQGTLWMDRMYSPGLQQQTSAGGKITGKYRPVNKQVYFN
jgi:hypothetical protein